jgi:diguanylate cyclase (GGDEF)-like protein
VDIGLNPVRTHNGLMVVCSIIDMAKRREVERLLTNKIQLLEREVSTLDKLAKTDELTSLNNHRFLITQLELHITIAYKNIEPISFVMVDIDDFKKYNDSYGHLGGDEVLKLIAKLLELSVRHGEIVARYGGEEFGIILPASDAREAKNTSERLRKIIEEFECPFQRITVSLGCATVFPVLSQSVSINEVHDLIEMADKALYHSKSKGKNTVTHFDEIRLSNI